MDGAASAGAVIRVRRTSQLACKWRKIKVWIDGAHVGSLRDGETADFPVTLGAHTVWASVDWCKTQQTRVVAVSHGTVELQVGSPLQGWRMLFARSATISGPGAYIDISRI
jgi:hypothetical protein